MMDLRKKSLRSCRPGLAILIGVSIGMPVAVRGGEAPTFHRDVAPILQKNCQECHRPGQVAPFSLLDYAQARKRAQDIAAVTEERTMPPWHASTTEGGPFQGRAGTDRRGVEDAGGLGRRGNARREIRRTERRRGSGIPIGPWGRPTWSSGCPSRTSWDLPGRMSTA